AVTYRDAKLHPSHGSLCKDASNPESHSCRAPNTNHNRLIINISRARSCQIVPNRMGGAPKPFCILHSSFPTSSPFHPLRGRNRRPALDPRPFQHFLSLCTQTFIVRRSC